MLEGTSFCYVHRGLATLAASMNAGTGARVWVWLVVHASLQQRHNNLIDVSIA